VSVTSPLASPEWMKPAEAAIREGVHENTIRRWVKLGYLPAVRHGRKRIFISTADLDAMTRPVGGADVA
jgi:excisionase family DNA binding protein